MSRKHQGFLDWTALIELLSDAWLGVLQNQPMQAMRIAHDWISRPYPTFKRLALFAATHDGITPQGEWVDWLLADACWWLWSIDTQRETMRLLVLRGPSLPVNARARLEIAILAGPPRQMYRANIEAERWQELVDHSVWLHLAKLASGGGTLGGD